MTYDRHGSWDKVTGHHTAIVDITENGKDYYVPYAAQYWIKGGFPPEKIALERRRKDERSPLKMRTTTASALLRPNGQVPLRVSTPVSLDSWPTTRSAKWV